MSGSFTSSVNLCSASNISLFELNVDRNEIAPSETIGSVDNNNLIYPFIIKDGTRLNFRTNTAESFISTPYGDPITGAAYPYTASITKEFYGPWTGTWYPNGPSPTGETPRFIASYLDEDPLSAYYNQKISGNISHLLALKNTINDLKINSPHFEYSSSVSGSVTRGIHNRDFQSSSVGLVSIPSIFYGSSIKRGSVNLEFYFTGTLIGRAQDITRNGELIEVYDSPDVATTLSGTVVGLVLYDQGIILLTSSLSLNTDSDNYTGSTTDNPRWTYFAQSFSPTAVPTFPPVPPYAATLSETGPLPLPIFPGWNNMPSSSFIMEMSGTTQTQVITMFATAPKGELNHSNNPSYLQNSWYTSSYTASISTASSGYLETDMKPIKNVVSSAYNDPTGSFEKTTYISKVAIYDAQKNLIGIAKTATPIRKTVERDFTFKLKLDI